MDEQAFLVLKNETQSLFETGHIYEDERELLLKFFNLMLDSSLLRNY
jgi:hypothetical protein